VHGDVFRPPQKGMLLAVLIGNGVQIAIMSLITLIFACFGFLSPASRGALMTCAIVCYVLLGTPAGYTSARLYKMFGGERWKKNVLMTAVACPGLIFGIFFILNLVLWANGSSAAIPFTTFLALLALWFCVSTPLVFIGAYLGFKRPVSENPVRTNQIPRQVPEQTLYTKPLPGILMGGILPFGCIFIQLFFILNSIWAHQYYYFFGFLMVVYIILIITCSETTILLCYFHLCAEDYNWWWRSFLTSGFTAVYFFLYSIYYFSTKLEISDGTSTFLYFGYTVMLTFILFLFTGTIGFLACFWFVRIIYSVIKPMRLSPQSPWRKGSDIEKKLEQDRSLTQRSEKQSIDSIEKLKNEIPSNVSFKEEKTEADLHSLIKQYTENSSESTDQSVKKVLKDLSTYRSTNIDQQVLFVRDLFTNGLQVKQDDRKSIGDLIDTGLKGGILFSEPFISGYHLFNKFTKPNKNFKSYFYSFKLFVDAVQYSLIDIHFIWQFIGEIIGKFKSNFFIEIFSIF
ncbi:unnamed protein product, partial [Rotaria sp. Silwood2]